MNSESDSRLVHAILGVRKRSGKAFETLYILTCKNTYADIFYTNQEQSEIWKVIGYTYSEIWERAEEIPGEDELRSWIRSIISLVYGEVTGKELEGFPDEGETFEEDLEPYLSEMLFRLDDVLGIYKDSDDEDTLVRGSYETIESEERRNELNKKFRVRAVLGIIVAVIICVAAVAVVWGTLKSLKKRDDIINRRVNSVIIENTQSETIEAPHGEN